MSLMTGISDDDVGRAWQAADAATAAAEIEVREATSLADFARIQAVFADIWEPEPGEPLVTREQLVAYAHTGQYVVVAHDLTRPHRPIIAASVGFLAAPVGRTLHSHITGVL